MKKTQNNFISFEEKSDIINQEILKRKGKWRLTAISYMDYDDVSQILRVHIFNKWALWNQSRPLEQWLNSVITHQMINLVRNHYGRVAPPCNGCAHNVSDDFCSFTKSGVRCAECPLYKKWQEKTQVGYNLKLASSINAEEFVEPKSSAVNFSDHIDYESSSAKLHLKMKECLSHSQYKIYDLLIIQNLSDKEVARILKFKSSEKGRTPGYKHLTDMRNKFYEMAKKIINENDIL